MDGETVTGLSSGIAGAELVRSARPYQSRGWAPTTPADANLASWVAASREAVSKAFQTLRTLNIVDTGRRRVTVHDLAALERHAE